MTTGLLLTYLLQTIQLETSLLVTILWAIYPPLKEAGLDPLSQLLFWPPNLLADGLATIKAGDSALILGPRRSGKTTLMRAIANACQRDHTIISMTARMEVWDLLRIIASTKPRPDAAVERQVRSTLFHIQEGFREAIDAVFPEEAFVLFIDDFDFAIGRDGDFWTHFLGILQSSRPKLSLVLCSDPAALSIADNSNTTPSRTFPGYRVLHLAPWPADIVETFIRNTSPTNRYTDGDFPRTLAQLLAPAWPYEVLSVLFAIDQLGDLSPTSIERVLDDLTLRMYGPEPIEKRVKEVVSSREFDAARQLLHAFGLGANKLTLTEASDRSSGRLAEHDFARAGQRLATLSFLQFITPRSLQPLTGLVRRKLQLDYAGSSKS